MSYPAVIHQAIDHLSWGDATSNHTILLRDLLRRWGIRSDVYSRSCDPCLVSQCRPLRECRLSSSDWLIYQYSLDSPVTDFALSHARQTFLSYHNVTPPDFFSVFDPPFGARLRRAMDGLRDMTSLAGAVTDSRYNRYQLEELGFSPVFEIPPLFSLSDLSASAGSSQGRRLYERLADGHQNILFVGRIAPNKRIEHLVQAFSYYHHLVELHSRLLLVGASPHSIYQAYLEMLLESLELTNHVVFAGRVGSNEGFGAFYRAADVFLCLSEHEGFCVPLVESMYFDLPIIAYKSSAVPETLGDCGVLVSKKRYDVIGELIYSLVNDHALRQLVIRKQRERLMAFDRSTIEGQIKDWVKSLNNVR